MLSVAVILFVILHGGVSRVYNVADDDNVQVAPLGSLATGMEPRIIGGTAVDIRTYPFLAQIIRSGQLACGGSLLTRSHILSAAQCFFDPVGASFPASSFSVRVGTSDIDRGGSSRWVLSVVAHNQFNLVTRDNDIAIVITDRPVNFGNSVQGARLPAPLDPVPNNLQVIALGWGVTDPVSNTAASTLQQVLLGTISRESCQQSLGSQMTVTTNMICAGPIANATADTCTGDNGGPLVLGNIIVGIISSGSPNCGTGAPRVFTQISQYTTWIDYTVRRTGTSSGSQVGAGIIAVVLPVVFLIISV